MVNRASDDILDEFRGLEEKRNGEWRRNARSSGISCVVNKILWRFQTAPNLMGFGAGAATNFASSNGTFVHHQPAVVASSHPMHPIRQHSADTPYMAMAQRIASSTARFAREYQGDACDSSNHNWNGVASEAPMAPNDNHRMLSSFGSKF